jgi:hypothetical protein
MTSRMDGLLVSSMTSRSIPIPSPPAGGNEEAHAMDEDYIRALEFGMPPAR